MKLTRELATKLCELSLKSELKIFIGGDHSTNLEVHVVGLLVAQYGSDYYFYFDEEVEVDIYQLNNDILEA